MPEETCTSLNVDMNDCTPKRLCCNEDGAKAYNRFGACPPNQGYSINFEKCACCRPPCTPTEYRVTATFYRRTWYWETCISGDECTIGGYPRVFQGDSFTQTLDGLSNPFSYELEIKEAPLTYIGVCNCYGATGEDGYYVLRFDDGCPTPQGMGLSQLKFQNAPNTCEGPCNDWSVEAAFYHTIDLIERFDSDSNQWVPA